MPKKVLIVSRYFWPDKTPESLILYSIATFLKSKGHEIDILSSQPSYRQNYKSLKRPCKEIVKGVRIFRLKLTNEIGRHFIFRILNAITLSFKTISLSLINRYEVVLSTSNPPILGPCSGALASLLINARFVYYCMDIMPEVGTISGDFANPLIFKILQKIDIFSCLVASPLIVHSIDMKNTFLKRENGYKFKFEIINNFSVKTQFQESLNDLIDIKISQNKLTVLYAGNIGRFQSLENVIEGMSKIKKDKEIELLIMGEGVRKDFLIKLSQRLKANVRFLPYQDPFNAKRIINQVDIGLISLSKGIYKYAYPSKTMSYLEQGKPIIAIVEKESQMADDIQSQNFGYIIEENIENSLPSLLKKIKDNKKELYQKKSSVLNNYEKLFSPEVILNKWETIINKKRK